MLYTAPTLGAGVGVHEYVGAAVEGGGNGGCIGKGTPNGGASAGAGSGDASAGTGIGGCRTGEGSTFAFWRGGCLGGVTGRRVT